jgi:hypothetical protein
LRAYGNSVRREGEILCKASDLGIRVEGLRNQWVSCGAGLM